MFKKVQFIGVALCTTPANLISIEGTSDDGYYAGIEDNNKDLYARLEIIKQSLKSAILANSIDNSKETLKVFVLPEFFMRGVQGAYYNSFIYPMEARLIDEFKNVLRDLVHQGMNIGADYLFVLGTILSTCSQIDINEEPTSSLYNTGDNLLDVYYRLHPEYKKCEEKNLRREDFGKLLKIIDQKEVSSLKGLQADSGDNAYVDILKKTLDYCDSQATIKIGNRCLITSGADILFNESNDSPISMPGYRAMVVQKQFKSKEDFILNSINNNQVSSLPKYLQTTTKYYDIDNSEGETKKYPTDGLAIFEYEGLKIGVDICLDHSRQRLVKHLYKHPNDYVDLQIITSCGMSVRSNAVIAKTGGIVFNCDGEYELCDKNAGVDGKSSHTTLQRISRNIIVKDNMVESGAQLENAQSTLQQIPCNVPDDTPIFCFKEYSIHIYEPLELK